MLRWEVYPGLFDGHKVIITRIPVSGSRKQSKGEVCRCSPVVFEDGGSGRWMQVASRSQKRQEKHSSLEPVEGTQPCGHQDFKPSETQFGLLSSRMSLACGPFHLQSQQQNIFNLWLSHLLLSSNLLVWLSLSCIPVLFKGVPVIIFGPSG